MPNQVPPISVAPTIVKLKKMTEKDKKRKPSKEVSAAFALVGSMGGKATAKKHGKKHMKEIGKRGAEKRWGKK